MRMCLHERTRKPAPVPDWTGICPDCGEKVTHDGRGGFITVREHNERIARRVHLTLEPEDVEVLCEALWHAVQRGDILDEERQRMHTLRDVLCDCGYPADGGAT